MPNPVNIPFHRNKEQSPRWIMPAGLKIVFTIAILAILVIVRDILLMAFLSVLLAVVFSYPLEFLTRYISRALALILVITGFLGCITGIIWVAVPVISDQVSSFTEKVPEIRQQVERWYTRASRKGPVAEIAPPPQIEKNLKNQVGNVVQAGVFGIVPAAKSAAILTSEALFIFVLGAFLVAQPQNYKRALKSLIPYQYEYHFEESWRRIGHGLRDWVGGIVIAMTLMGSFTAIGLKIAGIENWFLLSILTFFGTFIPYLGAILSAIPGLIFGFAQSPTHFVYALIVYIGVHLIEGYIVEPIVMKHAVEMQPGILLLGQAVFGVLFGVLGVALATPLMICIKVCLNYFYVELKLRKN